MPDVYFKKTIDFTHRGQALQFRVAQDLFSSHQIDVGTARLLRSLDDDRPFHKILDLGCGYGPLGLTLKKLHPDSSVHLVDRDALAVEYTRQNAALNRITDASAYGSLGYDDVQDHDFDLIISNIPGKAGEAVIESMLLDACHFLEPGGLVAIVVVAPLADIVAGILDDPNIHVVFQETRSGHAIFHYRFSDTYCTGARPTGGAFDRGLYHRDNITVSAGDLVFPMQTARGLPEFDTLSYRSELLIAGLLKQHIKDVNRVIVFNPGQGHIPVVMWKLAQSREIVLVDRDLLSLRYAQHNLVLNGCPAQAITISHQVGLLRAPQNVDLIAGILREGEGRAAAESLARQAAALLRTGGMLVLAAGSTPVTRLTKFVQPQKQFGIKKRKRDRGKSLLVLCRK